MPKTGREEWATETPEMALIRAQTEALVMTLGARRGERFIRAMADRVVARSTMQRSGPAAARCFRLHLPLLARLIPKR